jgi:protein-tyrosine phosphatase
VSPSPSPNRVAAPAPGAAGPPVSWRRHPLVLAGRRFARNLAATAERLRTRNPPLPAAVGSVLFVCKGNICRSPFAAYQASRLTREAGLPIAATSAGLKPSQANACPDDAIAAADSYGHDMRPWRPVLLTDDLMEAHDLIVVMETDQFAAVRARWPRHRGKTVLLALYGPPRGDAWTRLNIADPFGKDRAAFDACYARIDTALADLFSRLRAPAHG